MSIIDALDDLKSMILGGTEIETALADTAEEYGFAVTMLRNRAEKAFGSLGDLAAIHASRKAAMAHQEEVALRKVALGKAEARILHHNSLPAGHKDRLGTEQLHELIELANSLGGKWQVTSRMRRAPRHDSMEKIMRDLLRILAA